MQEDCAMIRREQAETVDQLVFHLLRNERWMSSESLREFRENLTRGTKRKLYPAKKHFKQDTQSLDLHPFSSNFPI